MKSKIITTMTEIEPGLTPAAADVALHSFVAAVRAITRKGEEARIPGFGTFRMVQVPARDVRNPATGATVRSPAKEIIKFRAPRAR